MEKVIYVRTRSNGSFGIPKSVRKFTGIVPGQTLKLHIDGSTIMLEPIQRFCPCCESGKKSLSDVTGLCTECEIQVTDLLKTNEEPISLSSAIKRVKIDNAKLEVK